MKKISLEIHEEDIEQSKIVLEKFKKYKTEEEIFYNLCFVILIPQAKWTSVRKIIDVLIGRNFFEKDICSNELIEIIKSSRFKNRKTKFLKNLKLIQGTEKWRKLLQLLRSGINTKYKRIFLLNCIKGLGMKTASHFLRNIGEEDIAIIDTHILKFLNEKNGPKSIPQYLEMENEFFHMAKSLEVSVQILDTIIWKKYSGTEWNEFDY